MIPIIGLNTEAMRSYFPVRIQNGSGYVSSASIRYNLNGNLYRKSSGMFTLGFSTVFHVPKVATDIYVEVFMHIITVSQSIYKSSIVKKRPYCLYMYGTVLYPVCIKVPCVPYLS